MKKLKCDSVISNRINCRGFTPIARVGDVIEFEMCGNTISRPVFHVSANFKTFIILTSNGERNKELFTLYQEWSCGSKERTYYDDNDHYNIKNNLMLGFVNYKFIKRVVRNVVIPDMRQDIVISPLAFLSDL